MATEKSVGCVELWKRSALLDYLFPRQKSYLIRGSIMCKGSVEILACGQSGLRWLGAILVCLC